MNIYVNISQLHDARGKVYLANAETAIECRVGEGYGIRALKRLKEKLDAVINDGLRDALTEGE